MLMQTHLSQIELFDLPGEQMTFMASATKCRRCGRVLKNPASIAIGMGPTCAGGKRTAAPREAKLMRAKYDWIYSANEGIVWIIDRCTPGAKSVTNDAEEVVRDIMQRGVPDHVPLVYRDSEGRWDRILVKDGAFAGFEPWSGPCPPN